MLGTGAGPGTEAVTLGMTMLPTALATSLAPVACCSLRPVTAAGRTLSICLLLQNTCEAACFSIYNAIITLPNLFAAGLPKRCTPLFRWSNLPGRGQRGVISPFWLSLADGEGITWKCRNRCGRCSFWAEEGGWARCRCWHRRASSG